MCSLFEKKKKAASWKWHEIQKLFINFPSYKNGKFSDQLIQILLKKRI